MKTPMQIGELAKQSGVPTKTIRYYEEIGLLADPPRTEAGYRLYSAEDVARLAFIRRARTLDFSLGEINEILNCRASGDTPCPYVSQLIHEKIAAVKEKITQLEQLERELRMLEQDAARPRAQIRPRRTEICHILEKSPRKNSRRRIRKGA